MLRYFQYYLTAIQIEMQLQFQYRMSLVVWLLGLVVEPVIFLMVWQAAATTQGGLAGNYSPGDFAAYFMVMMVVNHLTFTWIMYQYSYLIREGMLAARLLYPIHPIHKDICDNVCYKLLTVTLLVPVLVLMYVVFKPNFQIGMSNVLAFLPALAMAGLSRFLLEWSLAQLAFWIVDTGATNLSYMIVMMFFSGRIAPIDLFPAGFEAVASSLPFRWFLAFPVEVLLGTLDWPAVQTGYLIQLGWCAGIWILMNLVWKVAIRQFGAVGA